VKRRGNPIKLIALQGKRCPVPEPVVFASASNRNEHGDVTKYYCYITLVTKCYTFGGSAFSIGFPVVWGLNVSERFLALGRENVLNILKRFSRK